MKTQSAFDTRGRADKVEGLRAPPPHAPPLPACSPAAPHPAHVGPRRWRCLVTLSSKRARSSSLPCSQIAASYSLRVFFCLRLCREDDQDLRGEPRLAERRVSSGRPVLSSRRAPDNVVGIPSLPRIVCSSLLSMCLSLVSCVRSSSVKDLSQVSHRAPKSSIKSVNQKIFPRSTTCQPATTLSTSAP